MVRFIPVTKELKNKFWKKPENMLFAKNISAVPVAIDEISKLSLFLPLVFIKGQNEKYELIALLNLLPQGNLFVNNQGGWIGRYIPWFFLAHPFTLGFTEKKEPVLLIDEDFLVSDSEGRPIFKENEELDDEIINILKFLLERARGYQMTSQICDKIAEMELFEPLNLKIKTGEQEKPIEGLYKINLEKYTQLEDEKILELRKYGAFILIYAHLFSLNNLEMLVNLLKFQASQAQSVQAKKTSEVFEEKKTHVSEEISSEGLEEILKELKFPEK